jgi:phosphoglycolate phosphatase-like HAD superfamily hydrolase
VKGLRFFDFDGCLFDTAYECAVVVWCVRHDITRDFRSVNVGPEFLHRFYALKPYIRYAREYIVFSSESYLSIADQVGLDRALTTEVSRTQLEEYQDRFYRTREAIKGESFEAWLALNRPYTFAVEALRRVAETAIILSSKDRKTIVETLTAADVSPLGVYDFSYAPSKLAALNRLREEGLSLDGAVFLDDNIDHLLEAHASGVRPVLASWGYVTPEQGTRARAAHIPVATPTNLRALLGIAED